MGAFSWTPRLQGADVFLETGRKDFRMSGPEERARGGAVFHYADDHRAGGGASGLSDQTVSGTLAGDGSPVCRPYGQTHHPTGDEDQGDRTGAGRHAMEAGRRTVRRGRRRGPQPGQGVS